MQHSHDSSKFIQHCLLVDRLHSLSEVLSIIREETPNNKSPEFPNIHLFPVCTLGGSPIQMKTCLCRKGWKK